MGWTPKYKTSEQCHVQESLLQAFYVTYKSIIMKYKHLSYILIFICVGACQKRIEIAPPIGTITSSQVFSTDDQAVSAVSGIYLKMINTNQAFANYGMTIFAGLSADELTPFIKTNPLFSQFLRDSLLPTNTILINSFWG